MYNTDSNSSIFQGIDYQKYVDIAVSNPRGKLIKDSITDKDWKRLTRMLSGAKEFSIAASLQVAQELFFLIVFDLGFLISNHVDPCTAYDTFSEDLYDWKQLLYDCRPKISRENALKMVPTELRIVDSWLSSLMRVNHF